MLEDAFFRKDKNRDIIDAERLPIDVPHYREKAPDIYWRLLRLLGAPARKLHRVKIVNHKNLPRYGDGGVIIAGVHNAALDACFISIAATSRGRSIRWVADNDICETPVVGDIIKDLGCIPIASDKGRGTDPEQVRRALSAAREVIDDGGTVGLFPEGRIMPVFERARTFPFKTGIIRLAIETGAPIIPAWAEGADAIFPWLTPISAVGLKFYLTLPLWTPVTVRVHFGKPFFVDKKLTLESSREELKKEAAWLQQQAEEMMLGYKD